MKLNKSLNSLFNLLLVIFLIKFSLLIATNAVAEVQEQAAPQPKGQTLVISSWLTEQTDQYLANLKKQSAALSPEDINRSEQLIKEAKQQKQWSVAATEYARVLGKNPNNIQGWLELAAIQQKIKQTENSYRAQEEGRYAALLAYRLAKDPKEQTEALLMLGNSLDPESTYESPSYSEVLEIIQSLGLLEEVRKSGSMSAALMPFQYSKMEVNTDNPPANVCFSFTQPLATQNVNYEDYLSITPKVDGSVKINGRQLCIAGVQFGATYDVLLKSGLPNRWGDKIKEDTKLSVKIKDQSARLSFSSKAYILLRDEKPVIPLTGVNVENVNIKVIRINDRALNEIANNNSASFLEQFWGSYAIDQIQNSLGELVYEGSLVLGGNKNNTQTKQIPFSEIVKEIKPGVYVIYAEETGAVFGDKARATQWIVLSDFGLTSFSEGEGGILVNVRSLKTAEPLRDIELQLISYNNTILGKIKTDAEGVGYFDPAITRGKGGNRPLWILAYGPKGDFSILDLKQPGFDLSDRGVAGKKTQGPLEAFLYSEQGVYRPGDTVHLNALLRNDNSDAVSKMPLTFIVQRPDEVEVARFVATGNEVGFYEKEVPLSSSARTGRWSILCYTDVKKDPIGRLNFAVEDFVPSRILVKLESDKSFMRLKEPVKIHILGRYLFGAKAQGLTGDATLTLKANPNPYPSFKNYQFGLANEEFTDIRSQYSMSALNKEGEGNVDITVDSLPKTSKALNGIVRVTLSDQGGRPEIGSLTLPMITTPLMIGIKTTFDKVLNDTDNEALFEVITLDPNSNLVAASKLEYELYEERVHYTWYQPSSYQPWQYQKQVEDNFLTKGIVDTKKEGPAKLNLAVKDWGQYRLEIRDPKTGAATSIQFSKGWSEISKGGETPDRLNIKTDKDKAAIGDTVTLLITAPFTGQAFLTIANNKIIETRNLKVSKDGTKVKIKAQEGWGNGVYILVSATRPLMESEYFFFKKKMDENKPFLPKRAIGVAFIEMDRGPKTFNITMDLPKEIKPLQPLEIPILVQNKDNGKAPSAAYVTISAVDEGILKLTDFATPNPENFFLGQRQLGVLMRDYYGKLIDPLPGPLAALRSGGDASMLSRNMQALSKRSFKIVSIYKGLVPLDKGKAKISLTLPDFNGSLRLMAVAFDAYRVGSQSAELLVRDPIVVEGILPRFLAKDDESQLTVLLNNVSSDEENYTLTAEATGTVQLKQETPINIKIKQGESQHLVLPIRAKETGNGKIVLSLKNSKTEFKHQFEITVRNPFPYTENREYHLLKAGESLQITRESWEKFTPGTLLALLSFGSKVPWDVEGLYENLIKYPFRCIEQMLSRGYAFMFHGNAQDKNALEQTLAVLSEKQKSDGSFALWYEGESDNWLTAYAVDFMLRAKEKQYSVPEFSVERGLNALFSMASNVREDDYTLSGTAYCLYVLTKTDRIESGSIRYFYDTYFEKLKSPAARAMIAQALVAKGDLMRGGEAFKQLFVAAGAANGDVNKVNSIAMLSPYSTMMSEKAIVLTLLYETQKMVKSLDLGSLIESIQQSIYTDLKKNPRLSTQDMAWLILAANAFNNGSPSGENNDNPKVKENFTVKVNDKTLTAKNGFVYLTLNEKDLGNGINIQNTSQTPLWQTLEISGIAKDQTAVSQGLEIKREYYTLDGQEVNPQSVTQGTQLVTVLSGKATDEYPSQVLVNDLLPAGFEIENTRLGFGTDLGQLSWLQKITKPDYFEPRDDRYLAFLYLDEKTRDFKLAYQIRAVTPGTYVLPGLSVEDMYAPEYFARTQPSSIQVKAPSP